MADVIVTPVETPLEVPIEVKTEVPIEVKTEVPAEVKTVVLPDVAEPSSVEVNEASPTPVGSPLETEAKTELQTEQASPAPEQVAPAPEQVAEAAPVPEQVIPVPEQAAEVAPAPEQVVPVPEQAAPVSEQAAKPKLIDYLTHFPLAVPRQTATTPAGATGQFVILAETAVMKGPFTPAVLETINLRSRILQEMQVPYVLHPQRNEDGSLYLYELEMPSGEIGQFLVYPNLASEAGKTAAWGNQEYIEHAESFSAAGAGLRYRVLKTRVGLVTVQEALESGQTWLYDSNILMKMMIVWVYLAAMGTGDTGLHNALVDISGSSSDEKIFITDYDEDRIDDLKGSFFYLTSPPSSAIQARWLPIAQQLYPMLYQYFAQIYNLQPLQQDLATTPLNGHFHQRLYSILQLFTTLSQPAPTAASQQFLGPVAIQTAVQVAPGPVPGQTDAAPGRLPPQTYEQLKAKYVKTLKAELDAAGISTKNLKLKEEYIQRYLQATGSAAQAAPTSGPVSNVPAALGPAGIINYPVAATGPVAKQPRKVADADPARGPVGLMVWNCLFSTKTQSYSGLTLDVLRSILQKAIRRGDVAEGLHSAVELYRLAELPGGKPAQSSMYNRLYICAVEEIGLANPALMMAVLRQREADLAGSCPINPAVLGLGTVGARAPELLAAMIHAMAVSEKTRMLDHYYHAYVHPEGRKHALALNHHRGGTGLKIDTQWIREDWDYATAAVQRNSFTYPEMPQRAAISFWKQEDPVEIRYPAELFLKKLVDRDPNAFYWADVYFINSFGKQIASRNRRRRPMIVLWDMLSVFINRAAIDTLQEAFFDFYDKSDITAEKIDKRHTVDYRYFLNIAIMAALHREDLPCMDFAPWVANWSTGESKTYLDQMLAGQIPFPKDYIDKSILDMHTKEGKKNGANSKDFVTLGAQVNNQSQKYHDALLKEIYEYNPNPAPVPAPTPAMAAAPFVAPFVPK